MKVAVLCLQGLGDALMATPALRLLRNARPDWEIHAVALRSMCAEMLKAHPAIDSVHLVPYWDKDARAALAALPSVRKERFDLSILAYPTFRAEYHLFSFMLGAKRRISHDYQPTLKRLAFLETDRVGIRNDAHNVINNANLLSPLGIDTAIIPPEYDIPASWRDNGSRRTAVGMHVGSIMHMGNENKRWPLERFIEVARAISRRGHEIQFVRGPQEREATDLARTAVPGSRIIEGDVESVARRISGLHSMITGDNGIAHLSAAVGTPTIVLFGLTNPLHVAPWGRHVTVVRPSECPPCFEFGDATFRCKRNIDFSCLRKDLQVAHVLGAFDALNLNVKTHFPPETGPSDKANGARERDNA